MKDTNVYIIDIEGDNGDVEVERLKRQGYLVTKALPLLPAGFTLKRGRIVDLASGAGEWCIRVGKELGNDVEVIGVDLNLAAINYCNEMVKISQLNNVEFRLMDVMKPLAFDDDSCDLIHIRLAVGILPKEYWSTFLSECFRILKPGGILQCVEPGTNIIDASPQQHEMNALVLRALYAAGKTFSKYEYGVTSAINRLLVKSDFQEVKLDSYVLDYSKWAPLHIPLTEDFMLSVKMLKPFLVRFGNVTEQDVESLLAGCREEYLNPEYSALWNIVSLQAQKPA